MKTPRSFMIRLAALVMSVALPSLGFADEQADAQAAKIAKQLNNPVAALITVPMEWVHDRDIGRNRTGVQKSVKFTPVVPIEINEDWNLISRTIFSIMDQDIPEAGLDETGLTDIVQFAYFSPKKIGPSGLIWGAGPVILTDTATEDSLGAGKWGVGPAAVVLKQGGPWTVGALTHYLTSFAGDDDRTDVEQVFLQPFVSYNFNNKTSITVQSEGTWDLKNDNEYGGVGIASLNHTFKIGDQLFQGRVGIRHWYDRGGFGPDSTELMARLTLLFPR